MAFVFWLSCECGVDRIRLDVDVEWEWMKSGYSGPSFGWSDPMDCLFDVLDSTVADVRCPVGLDSLLEILGNVGAGTSCPDLVDFLLDLL